MWGWKSQTSNPRPAPAEPALAVPASTLPPALADRPPVDPMKRVAALGDLIARRRSGQLSQDEYSRAKAWLFGQSTSPLSPLS